MLPGKQKYQNAITCASPNDPVFTKLNDHKITKKF